MVDNVAITAGSGTTVATDDIGGAHYQRIKLAWGPDDTANMTDTASGKPMPVQLRSPSGTDLVGTAGTGSAAVLTVQGNASGTAIPVSMASVPSHAVTNAGTFAVQVDGSALSALQLIDNIVQTEDTASASGDSGVVTLAKRADAPATTSGTDGDYEPLQVSGGLLWVNPLSYFASPTTDITRPADTTAYATDDTLSDSTTAPTSGGYTLTGAARKSGGSGVLTDMIITSSNAGTLQGEIHLFNQAATNVNDNSAWNLSDADAKNRIAIIPFTLVADANNSYYHAQNLNIGYTCVGSANLRYLVKVKAAYTPISGEVITVTAKCMGVD